jgi:CHY zinc finger
VEALQSAPPGHNPIDHIFQFHKALRRELHQIEYQARLLQGMSSAADAPARAFDLELQRLSGRFLFVQVCAVPACCPGNPLTCERHCDRLRLGAVTDSGPGLGIPSSGAISVIACVQGIYQAHSVSEDEVVFPALEAKHKLRNVSKFYVLDHKHETELFAELQSIIQELQDAVRVPLSASAAGALRPLHTCSLQGLPAQAGHVQVKRRPVPSAGAEASGAFCAELAALVGKLRMKCASVRASLETHVRAEEAEIWPLFAEHFSTEEQSALVGTIIGRTGAVVLQALIPWVMDSFSLDETHAMMDSLRSAAKNTRFDRWLKSMVPPRPAAGPRAATPDAVPAAAPADAAADAADAAELAPATRPTSPSVPAVLQRCSTADSSAYRPGWVDIFRMNVSQLESAAAHSSPDDAHRDSYLAHHLMVSRFLVAQQQRMANEGVALGGAPDGAPPDYGAPRTSSAVERGCSHYRKNCNLIAPCCGKEVACRLCHDEQMTCSEEMDRHKVVDMVCQACGCRQPCAQSCASCHTLMARYYCSVCHLFDDTEGVLHAGEDWHASCACARANRVSDLTGVLLTLSASAACRPRHLPLPVLQHVPPWQGPRHRCIPLHAVQRMHVAGPVQQPHVPRACDGVQLPHLPRGPF